MKKLIKFKKNTAGITAAVVSFAFVTGCSSQNLNSDYVASYLKNLFIGSNQEMSYEKAAQDDSISVKDMNTLYEDEFGDDVLYITVGGQIANYDDNENWDNLNLRDLGWYEENDEEQIECDVLIQFGNEEGPTSNDYGFSDMSANASIKLSGVKASKRQQKSYRVKLKSGNISGTKSFVLSKGFGDPYRFTNKLCFDLMSEDDNMMSARTRFVHVYVKDLNDGDDSLFIDYGLYTMVETINKKYLKNRNLDDSGELYKVENFDFKRHEDIIVQPTDSEYDKDEFEKLLEAKGSNEYTDLIKLLDDLNSDSYSIKEIVDMYFDEDNLYSWMAFNILVDNKDTDIENFYLYSPTGSDKFFILPWDYDGALREDYNILKDEDYSAGWEKGIYLYTESELFSRIVSDEYCVNKLSEYVDKLHNSTLSAQNVSKKANELAQEVEPYLYSLPDKSYARVTKSNYETLVDSIETRIDENFYAFYDSIETPAPFHILEPEKNGDNVYAKWENTSCLNQEVSYSVELSDSWDFKILIIDKKSVGDTELNLGQLEPGEYFLRVGAVSGNGNKQEAFEYYITEKKNTVHGVICFYVLNDGTVVKSNYQLSE